MEQKLLIVLVVLMMLVSSTLEVQEGHLASATVVGNILSGPAVAVTVGLMMLAAAIIM